MAQTEKKDRNKLIKQMVRAGKSYREIGKIFKIHRSRVYQVFKDRSTKSKIPKKNTTV